MTPQIPQQPLTTKLRHTLLTLYGAKLFIPHEPPISRAELAVLLGVSCAQVNRRISKLEDFGYIERYGHEITFIPVDWNKLLTTSEGESNE
jgi:DNA-binding MarR family transcriptional regulator